MAYEPKLPKGISTYFSQLIAGQLHEILSAFCESRSQTLHVPDVTRNFFLWMYHKEPCLLVINRYSYFGLVFQVLFLLRQFENWWQNFLECFNPLKFLHMPICSSYSYWRVPVFVWLCLNPRHDFGPSNCLAANILTSLSAFSLPSLPVCFLWNLPMPHLPYCPLLFSCNE